MPYFCTNSDVYSDVKVTQNVKYGSNVPYNLSNPIDLLLDVYEPNGDLNQYRPLIIFMQREIFYLLPCKEFPGLGLKKDSAITFLCRKFAQKRYVAVALDYRVGWNPTAGTSNERARSYLSAI